MFDQYGSDAMRWFLMSSPILRGGNLIVTADGIRDTVRQVMLPVWSSYYFFTLYANAANGGKGYDARLLRADEVAALPEMDRYLLAAPAAWWSRRPSRSTSSRSPTRATR